MLRRMGGQVFLLYMVENKLVFRCSHTSFFVSAASLDCLLITSMGHPRQEHFLFCPFFQDIKWKGGIRTMVGRLILLKENGFNGFITFVRVDRRIQRILFHSEKAEGLEAIKKTPANSPGSFSDTAFRTSTSPRTPQSSGHSNNSCIRSLNLPGSSRTACLRSSYSGSGSGSGYCYCSG